VDLTFLTPAGAVFAVGALLPLAALAVNERRARRARRELGLASPALRSRIPTALAIALVPALLGLALAQPVLRSSRTQLVRKDAQAFYVLDTSDSMRAAGRAGGETRLDRALRAAQRIRLALRDVPAGVATMTDRVLPDLFPTPREQVFTATLSESVGVDRPPPKGFADRATTFAALDTLAGTNFFSPGTRHRLVVLLTDGETAPYFAGDLRQALSEGPRTSFVIVRFWRAGERVFSAGRLDPGYRPDPSSGEAVRELATVLDGRAFDENEVGKAIAAARRAIGHGPLTRIGVDIHVIALARWVALAALLPLAFLLRSRTSAPRKAPEAAARGETQEPARATP
jgi:hypothetical protein